MRQARPAAGGPPERRPAAGVAGADDDRRHAAREVAPASPNPYFTVNGRLTVSPVGAKVMTIV
jgi:hypothetical protein